MNRLFFGIEDIYDIGAGSRLLVGDIVYKNRLETGLHKAEGGNS